MKRIESFWHNYGLTGTVALFIAIASLIAVFYFGYLVAFPKTEYTIWVKGGYSTIQEEPYCNIPDLDIPYEGISLVVYGDFDPYDELLFYCSITVPYVDPGTQTEVAHYYFQDGPDIKGPGPVKEGVIPFFRRGKLQDWQDDYVAVLSLAHDEEAKQITIEQLAGTTIQDPVTITYEGNLVEYELSPDGVILLIMTEDYIYLWETFGFQDDPVGVFTEAEYTAANPMEERGVTETHFENAEYLRPLTPDEQAERGYGWVFYETFPEQGKAFKRYLIIDNPVIHNEQSA